MAEDLQTKLERLEKKVESAKKEFSRAEGSLDSAMSRLREEYKISSLEEGQQKVYDFEEQIELLQSSLTEEISKLEEIMEGR